MLTGAVALKEDGLTFISDQAGDVVPENPGNFGLYYRDTRFLSRFEWSVNGVKPLFLSSSTNKHYIAAFQFINPRMTLANGQKVLQQTVSMRRSRFVNAGGLYERLGFYNCNQFDIELEVVLGVDADFRDIFAVRGFSTQRVAGEISVRFGGDDLQFDYRGRDEMPRHTVVSFSRTPEAISSREVRFTLRLQPHQFDTVVVRVYPVIGDDIGSLDGDFDRELESLAASYREWDEQSTQIRTNHELFDKELLRASRYDIRTLIEHTPQGLVPDAGVPWYSVPFGRDAIITALQTLMYNPDIATGTLRFLAAHQGREVDQFREEEPGKILHELRRGELARLREVPHTPYYGTVDATPLFLVLFVETMDWLDSDELFQDLYEPAMHALEWIDSYGDADGDGYVEYIAHRPGGVVNQGWKDSANSCQYPDGSNATAPIALVEVQGYVYQAKRGMARLLRRRGQATLAERLDRQAEALKQQFNRDFWMEDRQFFAQALDRDKQQIRSVTSNPGHCLWAGICDDGKAEAVVRRLMAPDMFSGWGIRTLSESSKNYNPMSYHNGSVWPHDTAIIALGMRRCGYGEDALTLVQGLVDAAFHFPDARLPELFCGFSRDTRFNSSPTAYVVSCSPQAWAAGTAFMLLQTMLDVCPEGSAKTVRLNPLLPPGFRRVEVSRMRLGDSFVDMRVDGSGSDVRVEIRAGERLLQPATA